MIDTNKVEPVAYWIPKAGQFCIAVESAPPFAKVWQPLYPASTLAALRQERDQLYEQLAASQREGIELRTQLAEEKAKLLEMSRLVDFSTQTSEKVLEKYAEAQAEVERITGEWAALSQDEGKAEREIERLKAEVERLTKVDVVPPELEAHFRHLDAALTKVEPVAYVMLDSWLTGQYWPDDCFMSCEKPLDEATALYPASALTALQAENERLKDTLQDVRGHYERVCNERDNLAQGGKT
jgi:DNA repair ATPase RecN